MAAEPERIEARVERAPAAEAPGEAPGPAAAAEAGFEGAEPGFEGAEPEVGAAKGRWWRLLRASALGMGIAFVALIPPPIHFCTGPLGPVIGGFIAANSIKARRHEAWLIGLGMGMLVGIPAALIRFTPVGQILPIPVDWRPAIDVVTLILVPYYALLGTFGANYAAGRIEADEWEAASRAAAAEAEAAARN